MPAVQRLIIDTDGGIDDAVALALAVASPELSLCAVTTSYGNNTLRAATRNVQTVLKRLGGRRIRVIPGAGTPLDGRAVPPREAHGPTGLGGAIVDPLPSHIFPDPTALGRTILSTPRPVTLITIGPLTNLAHALRLDSGAIRERIRTHIASGGAPVRPADARRSDDFNTTVDSLATEEVRSSDISSIYIPPDVARTVNLTEADVARTSHSPLPFVAWLSDALRHYAEYHRVHRNLSGCFLPDLTAVAMAIIPDAFRVGAQRGNLDLDATNRDEHRDRRLTSRHVVTAFDIERERVQSLLIRVFGTAWPARKEGAL